MKTYDNDDELIDSSLQIGGEIHKQSEVYKKYDHIPKDVKYAYYDKIDKGNFHYKSNAYQTYVYVLKILEVSTEELKHLSKLKKSFYTIRTEYELKDYLKKVRKYYLWENINEYEQDNKKVDNNKGLNILFGAKESITSKDLLKEINTIRSSGVIPILYSDMSSGNTGYNVYKNKLKINNKLNDDFGLMHSMATITEVSKAAEGKERRNMNTTIQITRDEDLRNETEEKPEYKENKALNFFKKKSNNQNGGDEY